MLIIRAVDVCVLRIKVESSHSGVLAQIGF